MKTLETMRVRLLKKWNDAIEEINEEKKNGEYVKADWDDFVGIQRRMMEGLIVYVEDDVEIMTTYKKLIRVYHFED